MDGAREVQEAVSKKKGSKKSDLLVMGLMLIICLGLNWPYLGSGFTGDEIVLIKAMKMDPLPYSRWRGPWSGDVDAISMLGSPWWAEPGALGSFFRPVPGLVIEGSIRLFGDTAFPLHLIAVLLHSAIGFLVFLLVGMLKPGRFLPLATGLIYLICEDHSMSIGFISFSTDVFCVFFICLALLFHLSWLKRRKPLSLIASSLALVLALGCKETAAVAPLIIVLTSFFFPQGKAEGTFSFKWKDLRGRFTTLLRDPLSWVPALGILVLFLGLYLGLNLGGMNNLSYIDPFSNPGAYLSHLVFHLPVMWGAALSPIPPSTLMYVPESLLFMAGIGLFLFILFLWALWPRRKEPLVVWAFLLFHLALLPQLSTDAGERLLYLPFLFFAVLIALLIREIPRLAKRFCPPAPAAPRFTRVFGWYLVVSVVVLALIFSIIMPFSMLEYSRAYLENPLTAKPYLEGPAQHILTLNNRDFFSFLMIPTTFEDLAGRSLDVRILSACRAQASIERSGEKSFILRMDRKGWFTNFLAAAFRSNPVLEKGKVYDNDLFRATLLELSEDRSDVLAARFDMHRPLNDQTILFLYWTGNSYKPLDITSLPLQQTVILNPRKQ
jgi:hypothetical protein